MYIRVKRRRLKPAAVRRAEAVGDAAPEEWALILFSRCSHPDLLYGR